MATLLDLARLQSPRRWQVKEQLVSNLQTMLMNSYEQLLLLSFWTACQGKSRAGAIKKVNTDDLKPRFMVQR